MSRCFPYPPPGRESDLLQHKPALIIELLKLQKKKAKKDRKERKRDKKEKEKTHGGCGEIDKKHRTDKRRHKDKDRRHHGHGKERERQKKRENGIEQPEKSSLTEELGHPVCSQNSCDSSGSTVNHNKTYRTNSSFIGMESCGSCVNLVLPCETFKHELTEQLGSPTRNVIQEHNVAAHKPLEIVAVYSKSATDSERVRRSGGETSHESLVASRSSGPQSLETSPPPVFHPPPDELKFKDLVENWVPPPYCSEIAEDDDQEWLFSRNQNRGTKRIRAVADCSRSGTFVPWSHACLLPEVDLYALPFTVPL